MTAPTYIQEAETTAWNNTQIKTTPTHSVQTGDVIILGRIVESDTAQALTGSSGVAIGAGQLLQNSNLANACCVTAWGAAAASNTTASQTFTGDAVLWYGANALTFRGSDGIGASAKSAAKGAGTISITTTQANSAVVVFVGDWDAGVAGSWNTSAGTPTEVTSFRDAAHYTAQIAYYPDVGAAGAKTVGITGGAARTVVAVEVKGTAGGGGSVTGTVSSGQGSQSVSASGTQTITGTATTGQGAQSTTASGAETISCTAATAQRSQSAAIVGAETIAGAATTGQGSQSVLASGGNVGAAATAQRSQSAVASGALTIAGTATTGQGSQSVAVAAEVRPAVDLLWDAPSGWTPDGYRVKWGTSSGNYTQTRDVGAGVLTITIWGLTPNTTYYWVVVGLSGTEEQTLSAESTFHTFPASASTGQGSQSVSASGSVRIAGTATTGQGSQSSAGNQLVITGTAATGQGSQSAAGVGAGAAVSGAATTGQGSQSTAASGAQTITGAATAGQGSQSAVASGAETIAGGATTGQGSQSVVVAAQLVITGAATTGQGSQNASGVGAGAAISGPATTSQSQSATAAGYVLITGVATTGQGLQSASGSGAAPPIDGTATTGQGSQSALSSGAGVIVGTCNTGQGSQSANAAGIQSIAGSASTRQTQSVNGNGSIQIIGTANTSQGAQSARGGISSYREFDIITDDDGKYHIYTYV